MPDDVATINGLLDESYRIYRVADSLHHWAGTDPNLQGSSAPFAPTYFAYAFFAFNSLYSAANWMATLSDLRFHPRNCECCGKSARNPPEFDQIRSLHDATRSAKGEGFAVAVSRAMRTRWSKFVATVKLESMDPAGALAGLQPTTSPARSQVTQQHVEGASCAWRAAFDEGAAASSQSLEDDYLQLLELVYKVRCRIFHGSKPIEELRKPDQQRRCIVYTIALLALMDVFFDTAQQKIDWKPPKFYL